MSKVVELKKKPTQLPEPKGYRLLIGMPEVEEKTSGGIIKTDSARETEAVSSVVGFVIKMGDDAYKDEKRFPSGPYCKEGDFVIFRAFQGTRIKVHGQEFRLLNDDSIEAVVDDPRGYARA